MADKSQSTRKIKIGLLGSTGRVGRLLIDEILACTEAVLSVIFVREKLDFPLILQNGQNLQSEQNPQNPIVTNDLDTLIKSCEVIIDFSSKQGTASLLNALKSTIDSSESKSPACVIGTTGLDKEDFALMESLGKRVPILYAANMSLGIATLCKVVEEVARKLQSADIEISEIHHRFKKDAPSGTALALAHSCAKGRGSKSQNFITDRVSAGAREAGQISIASLRGGDVAGRHTVGFYLDGEYLEFTHNATSRATFAKGALACALWLAGQSPKLYCIDDMLANNS